MNVLVRTLSEFMLFAGLDEQSLAGIAPYIRERTYNPGQIIGFAGEPCEGVHLIVRGVVSTRRLSIEGREYVLDYLSAGECFDLVPVFDGRESLATTEALTHAVTFFIPCDQFLSIVQNNETVSRAAMSYLAVRVRYLSETVVDLALHTVRTRLARFLLARINGSQETEASGTPLARWTQEEIAAHIGTVRDVVGRTLRTFAREGIIRRERGMLVITDREQLEQEAMQEELSS